MVLEYVVFGIHYMVHKHKDSTKHEFWNPPSTVPQNQDIGSLLLLFLVCWPPYLKDQMDHKKGAIYHTLLSSQYGIWTISPFRGHFVLKEFRDVRQALPSKASRAAMRSLCGSQKDRKQLKSSMGKGSSPFMGVKYSRSPKVGTWPSSNPKPMKEGTPAELTMHPCSKF